MENEIHPQNVKKLRAVYGQLELVELYPAMLLEKTIPGSRTGPVLQCLLVKQFKALRDGDRFWYQNPGQFSPGQLSEIEELKLSDLLCSDSDNLEYVPENAFLLNSTLTKCSDK